MYDLVKTAHGKMYAKCIRARFAKGSDEEVAAKAKSPHKRANRMSGTKRGARGISDSAFIPTHPILRSATFISQMVEFVQSSRKQRAFIPFFHLSAYPTHRLKYHLLLLQLYTMFRQSASSFLSAFQQCLYFRPIFTLASMMSSKASCLILL